MPIKGLTDGAGRLIVAGKLSIGAKEMYETKDGRKFERPAQVDHFRFLVKNSETDKWCEDEEKTKVYGTPREVKIMFLSSNLEEIFPTSLKYYTSSAKICTGNGETATRFIECEPGENPKGSQRIKKQIHCSLECPDYLSKKCKAVGDLYFILAEKITLGSCYIFSTSSTKSTEQILASLQQLSSVSGGKFAGIPVNLKMVPVTNTYTDKDGKQQKSNSWTVYLELTAKDLKEFSKLLTDNLQFNGKMVPVQLTERAEIDHYSEFYPDESQDSEVSILQENAGLILKECWFFTEAQKKKKMELFLSETKPKNLQDLMNSFQDRINFINETVEFLCAGNKESKNKFRDAVCKNLKIITETDTPESYAEKILKTTKE